MNSVCMATYNGSRWIEPQLRSILPQLNVDDEIVIVDDGSSDDTVEKINQISDSRITLYANEKNQGVDATFEKALSLAAGEIIFLSDQDDIWYPGRVEIALEQFSRDPDITLVLGDAEVIDENGKPLGETYFQNRGAFKRGIISNLVKSKFLGCAIAIRSEIRDAALPFPQKIPGHDMWIGLVNELYGKSVFLDKTIIGYRRHATNASPYSHQSIPLMLMWRWQLAVAILPLVGKNLVRKLT